MTGAVVVDRWDRSDLATALDKVNGLSQARDRLGERIPWGATAVEDLFFLLFRVRPQLRPLREIDPGYTAGHVLLSLLATHPAVVRLRRCTARDLIGAAQAAARLAPQLEAVYHEACPDEAREPLEAALEASGLQPEERWLDELVERRRDELAELVAESGDIPLERLGDVAAKVAQDEEDLASAAGMWGLEPGELRRLPADQRLELARRLDTPEARRVTDLFGRLRSAMFAAAAEVPDRGVEPYDIELGSDLSRLVGSELLSMLVPAVFAARLGNGELAQYAVRGVDDAGRGGIVLCVDGSQSMAHVHDGGFTREQWATALKLFLLHQALREDRPMHVIDFGAANQTRHLRFVDPAERSPTRILEEGTTWFGGGTDFNTPLREAVQVLADNRVERADVVFVTDGDCPLSQRARDRYRRGAGVHGARTWGVQIGPHRGSLGSFADHVFTIRDLTSGRDLTALLDQVRAT